MISPWYSFGRTQAQLRRQYYCRFLTSIHPQYWCDLLFECWEELSKKYGLGFALLQRMGYSAGAPLAPGALVAPLAAKANPGRQGLTEDRAGE